MEETNIQATETPENNGRPSLLKQVLGAVVGGGLALAVYYAYDYAKPQVTAYLTLPVAEGGRRFDLGAARIADKSLEENERKRFVSKNLQVAQRIENRAAGLNDMDIVDDFSLDIDRISPEPESLVEIDTGFSVEEIEDNDTEMSIFQQQMATKEMDVTGEWDTLWGDIRDREVVKEQIGETFDVPELPNSGFGIGFLLAGAAGGAATIRRKKKA